MSKRNRTKEEVEELLADVYGMSARRRIQRRITRAMERLGKAQTHLANQPRAWKEAVTGCLTELVHAFATSQGVPRALLDQEAFETPCSIEWLRQELSDRPCDEEPRRSWSVPSPTGRGQIELATSSDGRVGLFAYYEGGCVPILWLETDGTIKLVAHAADRFKRLGFRVAPCNGTVRLRSTIWTTK